MKREDLTPEFLRNLLAYAPDTGGLTWLPRDAEMVASGKPSEAIRWNNRYAGRPAFTALMNGGYLCGAVYKISLQAHVAAWVIHTGQWPDGEIDHINGDRSDNRLSNLRLADHQQNQANSPRRSTKSSKFKGVYRYGNRWKAFIGLNRKTRYLGTFKTEAEAANAYMTVARSAFGDFAYRANEHSDKDSG